jgi:hypothetical protein
MGVRFFCPPCVVGRACSRSTQSGVRARNRFEGFGGLNIVRGVIGMQLFSQQAKRDRNFFASSAARNTKSLVMICQELESSKRLREIPGYRSNSTDVG